MKMKNEKNNRKGTKWYNFVYNFFVIQSIILPFSIFAMFVEVIKLNYYSMEEMKNLLFFLIVLEIIRLIFKVCTCMKEKTKTGYPLIIVTFLFDTFSIALSGFLDRGIVEGVITTAIGLEPVHCCQRGILSYSFSAEADRSIRKLTEV